MWRNISSVRVVVAVAVGVAAACATRDSASTANSTVPQRAPAVPPPTEPQDPSATAGNSPSALARNSIDRADLDRALEAGLGRFMQQIEVEPQTRQGRFVGWRIVRFAGSGLVRGDVVLSVNGRGVERPEQALDVWQDLRTRDEIVVEILREGHPLTLHFSIVTRSVHPSPAR